MRMRRVRNAEPTFNVENFDPLLSHDAKLSGEEASIPDVTFADDEAVAICARSPKLLAAKVEDGLVVSEVVVQAHELAEAV